jgi:hypothetical protein
MQSNTASKYSRTSFQLNHGLIGCFLGPQSTLVEYIEQAALLIGTKRHGFFSNWTNLVNNLVAKLGLERGHVVVNKELVYFLHIQTL